MGEKGNDAGAAGGGTATLPGTTTGSSGPTAGTGTTTGSGPTGTSTTTASGGGPSTVAGGSKPGAKAQYKPWDNAPLPPGYPQGWQHIDEEPWQASTPDGKSVAQWTGHDWRDVESGNPVDMKSGQKLGPLPDGWTQASYTGEGLPMATSPDGSDSAMWESGRWVNMRTGDFMSPPSH